MSKMSINDAAEHFGVSKEAIHNRIRRGSLKSIVEDGVKLVVVVDGSTPKRSVTRNTIAKATLSDDRYYKLLEEQNAKLQSRVEVLETETRSLRDQKEQMLIEERIKIENIYKEKDEQLKSILSSISSQFMLNSPQLQGEEFIEEHVEAEIEIPQEEEEEDSKIISLKKYLKKLNLSEKKQEKIYKKFKKLESKDERIILKGKKYFLDVKRFSYEDII